MKEVDIVMKVTVITVCFNSEDTIERTIQSVLSQTYSDIEYIICDGKSTDNTLNIVEKYKDAFNGRLTVISEQDRGMYDAMNKGIELAQGELIGIINSDDWYEPTAVEDTVNAVIECGKREVITYGIVRYYEDGQEESLHFYRHEFLKKRMISHPTCFVSKAVYDKIGRFDLRYRLASDYDFMLRAYQNNVDFVPIYKLIADFRFGGASQCAQTGMETLKIKKENGLIMSVDYRRKMLIYKLTAYREMLSSFGSCR